MGYPSKYSSVRRSFPTATIAFLWIVLLLAMAAADAGAAKILFWITFWAVVVYFSVKAFFQYLEERHVDALFKLLKEKAMDSYIENFLGRFSFEGKNIEGWEFRNRKIDWDRINDLEKYLIEKEIPLRSDKGHREIFLILREAIQRKEENLTRESIKTEPQKFAFLSGVDFEKLLYRLFEAMGYMVEPTGRSGDQGGDLIANKNGERILIQAKCYRDWSVGNEAVQQVVGAMKYYNCTRSMVITTSAIFTPGARALAKANNTELISKDRLSELLLQFLRESWG